MSLTETRHRGGFVVSEAEGTLSRELITVLSGQTLKAGHVVGKVTKAGTATQAFAGTGNGVMTLDSSPVLAGAVPGDYKVVCIAVATDSGTFEVFDPAGVSLGDYVVAAAAFATQIKFTIADGSTDFAAGDAFTVTVTAGSGKYKEYNPTNIDGSETAIAILYDDVDASAGDVEGAIMARQCEINALELVWFSGASSGQKTTGLSQLTAQTIIAR